LLGICVGPVKGPVNGLKSIKINDTPIEDDSGNLNFGDFTAVFADGDPLKFPQIVSLRLGAAGAPTAINVQLTNTSGTGDWVTRTVVDANAEAIDLRFIVSQLYNQTKSGIFEETLDIEIQMKPVGTSTWINPFQRNGTTAPPPSSDGGYDLPSAPGGGLVRGFFTQNTINAQSTVDGGDLGAGGSTITPYLTVKGKTTSPYVKELRIKVPNTGVYADKGWDIRCRLVEVDSVDADPNFTKRTVNWESMTAVFDDKLGDDEEWRAFSWLQLYGTASDKFNGVPKISGIYDTKIVQVPPSSVYDPDTRQYTGTVWDGSWSKAFTTDPAWIINDAISDSISGIARLSPGASLNKWDALELSKYASELVSDGNGGQQPRFSLNVAITEPQRSDDFIRYLAGACGATAWDNGDGEWRCAVDKPQNTVALFTNENIEGEFVYSHTDIDTRFNDVTVTFLNEEFDYREDRVRLTDDDQIAKFGRKPTKLVAVGCTNRQQAVRWAILKLRSNVNEFRAVSFTSNRQGKLIERFDWILVADGSLNQAVDDTKRTTGRIIANNGLSIDLRDTVRIETGVTYKVHVTVPNPDYDPDSATAPTSEDWQHPTITITRTLTNTSGQRGDVRTLHIDSALPSDVPENANVALEAAGLPSIPKVYRVLDVDYNDDGERVTLNVIEVDTAKYTASDEANYNYLMPGYGAAPELVPPPVAPTGGTGLVSLVTTNSNSVSIERQLRADWYRPDYPFIAGYRVERRMNEGAWVDLGITTELQSELMNPANGFYEFRIYTVSTSGRHSLPLEDNIAIGTLPQFAPVGFLTNESHTVAAAADGTGFDLTNAGGQFALYSPAGRITEDYTFEVIVEDGATATIDADGNYTITGLTEDTGQITFRAHWFDYQLDKIYTISKSKGGEDAKLLYIISDRQTVAYDSAGNPTPAAQTTTFTAQKQNTTAAVTWSVTDINGVARSAAACLSATTGDQVTMTAAQFATACNGTTGAIIKGTLTDGVTLSDKISVVKVAQGEPGADGSDGLHNAEVFLYQRKSTAPAKPSVNVTYTFGTGVASGQNNGWLTTPPTANGLPLWVTVATASSTGASDTIASSEWAAPVIMTQDGVQAATIYLYKRSATTPAVPSVTTTYTFTTGALSGINNGWSQTVPAANGDPLYVTTATALAAGSVTTDTIAASEWAAPTIMAQDGDPGPTIGLTLSDGTFDYIDGVPFDSAQSITITATKQNTSEAINWSSAPAVTLTGSGDSRTLSIANFGNNQSVVITATGADSGAKASVTITRNSQTTPNDSIIPDSGWRAQIIVGASNTATWQRNGRLRTQIP
jgi:predicted phage tail protein